MLPGFRFLFAAIVLSMSILVFGLGAAALLRAAHEEFASTPSWHAAPEPVFAQQSEATRPVLAMLRFEPPPAEQKASDDVAARAAPDAAPAEQAAIDPAPAEPEKVAALTVGRITAAGDGQIRNPGIGKSSAERGGAGHKPMRPIPSAKQRSRQLKRFCLPRRKSCLPRAMPARSLLNRRARRPFPTRTRPRPKSPPWATHPSPSKRRRPPSLPAQSPTRASSRSAGKRGRRPGVAGSRSARNWRNRHFSSRITRSPSP